MQQSIIARSIAIALLAASSGGAYAVSFTQNDVTLDISGTVNGYSVNREAQTTNTAGVTTTTRNSGISNGLLPGWINFVATTKVDDQDIKAHFSFAPGINNNSNVVGLPIGNPNPASGSPANPYTQIDTRNLYFQFGNNNWGTLKFGRDIGLFGQDVILSDMTLLGVGGTSNAAIPYNTTFGMVGHGYMYTGFQPQITYTTPNANGLEASVGIFQPSKFAGDQTRTPGLQAKVGYDWKGTMPGKVWAGLVTQDTSCSTTAACAASPSFKANGFEVGTKASFGNFDALAYTFTGKGLGLSTVGAQFLGGSNGAGTRTDSKGYFLQGTYKLGASGRTKIGLNYGKNTDKDGGANFEGGIATVGVNEINNKSYTLGIYHSLNKFVTLVGEYNDEKITNSATVAGGTSLPGAKNKTFSLGGIMFF